VLFVRWDCAGLGDRGLRLLVSGDDGRTWKPLRQPQLRGIRVGPPTATPDGGVVLLGGRGLDRYVVTLSIDR